MRAASLRAAARVEVSATRISIAIIGQMALLIRRFMAAVRASKRGTAFGEDGLRGEVPVDQCVFNLRVTEALMTVHAVEVPRCHNAPYRAGSHV
jgi:hypothetical protein